MSNYFTPIGNDVVDDVTTTPASVEHEEVFCPTIMNFLRGNFKRLQKRFEELGEASRHPTFPL
jgi:hypothetical protein